MEILLVKNFAGAEIRTHDLVTLVVLLQPVPFITADHSSWVPSDRQYSGGPGGLYRRRYGHWQTIPEPVQPSDESPLAWQSDNVHTPMSSMSIRTHASYTRSSQSPIRVPSRSSAA